MGDAVPVGIEVVGPDEDRPVRIDDVDDIKTELVLDLNEPLEEIAPVPG